MLFTMAFPKALLRVDMLKLGTLNPETHQPLSTLYLLDLVVDQAGDEDELELDDRFLPATAVVELYQLST